MQNPVTAAQQPRVLIITPTPINEYQLQRFDEDKGNVHPTRTNQRTREYAEAAQEVASSLNVPAVDLWTTFMTAAGWKEGQPLIGSREAPSNEKLASLLTDGTFSRLDCKGNFLTFGEGLHLTAEGYRIVYEEVIKAIRTNWPDQAPGVLPQVFPPWMEAPK